MKNYLKIAEAAFVLAVAIAATCYFFFRGKSHNALPQQKVAAIIADPSTPILKQFKDEVGENHVQVAANSNKVARAAIADTTLIRKSMLDTIIKRVNIKNAKDILEITRINETLQIQNAKLRKDTATKSKAILYYRDKWLYASVNLKDSTFNLNYNASITTTKFNRWKWTPFPTKIPVYDFYGDDPRLTISGIKHLLVEQPNPFFGLKVQGRTAFDIHSGRLIPSAGVEVKLGPFDLGGRYYYSMVNKQWQPIVSGTLNLLSVK